MICGAPSQQDISGERRKIGVMMWIKWSGLELKRRWDDGDNDEDFVEGKVEEDLGFSIQI